MKSWDELLDTYLAFMKTTHRSATTMKGTRRYIRMFREFCQALGVLRPADVTRDHAEAFERRMHWEPGPKCRLYSASTVQGALGSVRLFFRWLRKEHLLLTDPFRDIRIHRVVRVDRRILTPEEVQRLLAAPPSYTQPGIRDRALLETLYGAGLRREECSRLDLSDVDFETQTILVRAAKGGTQRRQPMGPTLQATLQDYLKRCRPHLVHRKKDDGSLFVVVGGRRMEGWQIGNIVRKHGENAGLGRVTTHLLRHAFATHLVQNGARLEEVQQLLGHELLQSTSIYTGVTPIDVTREHRATHPRARRKKRRARPSAPKISER